MSASPIPTAGLIISGGLINIAAAEILQSSHSQQTGKIVIGAALRVVGELVLAAGVVNAFYNLVCRD